MGGVKFKKLSSLARSIWKWCEKREIYVFASYISSSNNKEADFESRRLDNETEFELSEIAFRKIVRNWGYPEVDLFASRVNAKAKTMSPGKETPVQ